MTARLIIVDILEKHSVHFKSPHKATAKKMWLVFQQKVENLLTKKLDDEEEQQTKSSKNAIFIFNKNIELKGTHMPSIFGESRLKFNLERDILFFDEDTYYENLKQHILNRMQEFGGNKKRCVFVCFESKSKLVDFYNSQSFKAYVSLLFLLIAFCHFVFEPSNFFCYHSQLFWPRSIQ